MRADRMDGGEQRHLVLLRERLGRVQVTENCPVEEVRKQTHHAHLRLSAPVSFSFTAVTQLARKSLTATRGQTCHPLPHMNVFRRAGYHTDQPSHIHMSYG